MLEYLSRFAQEKRKTLEQARTAASRMGKAQAELSEARDLAQIDAVERVVASIPAQVISQRAVECGFFARALFHWEQYIRQEKTRLGAGPNVGLASGGGEAAVDALYANLHEIYTKIDEPDALEGISARIHTLDLEQQALDLRRVGKWPAVHSWYELQLLDRPTDGQLQLDFLHSLAESGSYGTSSRQHQPSDVIWHWAIVR